MTKRSFLGRLFHVCAFGHSSEWMLTRVDGVLYRECDRCLEPTTPILVNAEAVTIKACQVPAIKVRAAKVVLQRQLRKVG